MMVLQPKVILHIKGKFKSNQLKPCFSRSFRQILEFANGGVASLDWAVPLTPLPEDTPTLVVLHGLTGGSHENYIRGLLQIVSCNQKRNLY